MMRCTRWSALTLLLLTGCLTSSTPTKPVAPPTDQPSTESPANPADGSPATTGTTETTAATTQRTADGIPIVPIMTEVDGIPIPRLEAATQSLQLSGPLPVDLGNEHALKKPGEKATGDTLVIRFNSEPKTMNAITETSAVQTYISAQVTEALARQNPETFAFEPHIASRWVVEDSVKLAANYPGSERKIARDGGEPAETLTIDYVGAAKGTEPAVIDLTTFGPDGKPLGGVWVGVFSEGRIVGFPSTGAHQWSDAAGKVTISGMPTGKYTIRVGAEVYGLTTLAADGTLTVTPGTPENPLTQQLAKDNATSLTLKDGEWVNRQEQTYTTFYLRDDVKWSDGAPFTTKDIEFAYATINNTTVDGDAIRTYYSDLVECAALSPQIVRMRYRQQYFKSFEFTAGLGAYTPPFHAYAKLVEEKLGRPLTLERLTPEEETAQKKISAHGAEFGKFFNTDATYNRAPLGTGQYTVGRWETGDRLELVRNPNYWLPERAAYLDKIVVKFIPDNVTAMQAFKAGEIDFFWLPTPEQFFEDLKGPPDWFAGKYVKASWYSPMFNYFGYNMLKDEFKDRRVRIALSMLFDKADFLEKKLYGQGAIVSGTQYYFGPGYDHDVAPLAYDPETARDLLAAAGWVDSNNDGLLDKDGKAMKFKLPMPKGNAVAEERVQLFQRNLKDVGIELNIEFLEWASFIDRLKAKNYDICTLSWATPVESDPYQIWHSSGAGRESRGSNHVSFANPLADELIETMRVTLDETKRKQMHSALHHLLDQEQPYSFLYCVKDFGVYHQRFRGVKWYRLRPGFDLTEWYVPKDEQLRN